MSMTTARDIHDNIRDGEGGSDELCHSQAVEKLLHAAALLSDCSLDVCVGVVAPKRVQLWISSAWRADLKDVLRQTANVQAGLALDNSHLEMFVKMGTESVDMIDTLYEADIEAMIQTLDGTGVHGQAGVGQDEVGRDEVGRVEVGRAEVGRAEDGRAEIERAKAAQAVDGQAEAGQAVDGRAEADWNSDGTQMLNSDRSPSLISAATQDVVDKEVKAQSCVTLEREIKTEPEISMAHEAHKKLHRSKINRLQDTGMSDTGSTPTTDCQQPDSNAELVSCEICGFQCHWPHLLKRHMYTHGVEKPIKCESCDYRTYSKSHLKEHSRTHTGERPFTCDFCDRTFRYASNFRQHRRRHHLADFSPKAARKPSKITADVAPSTNIKPRKKPPKNIDCDLCEYKCRHKFQLKRHMSTHSGEKPFQCNFCPYRTAQKGHLNEHALIHGDQRPFACQYCKYASRTARNLRVHIGRRHEKGTYLRAAKTEFSCTLCTYKTTLSINLTSHMRTHTGDYLVCDVCSYKTIYPTDLKRHLMVHTGEKPYHCKQCDYKSIYNNTLLRHIRKHHPHKTVQKPLSTTNPECIIQDVVEIEMKTESCVTVEWEIKTEPEISEAHEADDVKNHHKITLSGKKAQKSVTAEGKYKCTECDYSTDNNANLTQHQRTHTGEKPFECELCPYRTAYKQHLLRHIRIIHIANKKPRRSKIAGALQNVGTSKTDGTPATDCQQPDSSAELVSCEICGFQCHWPHLLKRHMYTHGVEKPIKCESCDYRTYSKSHIKEHSRTHTGERPFTCDFCDKTFRYASNFHQHRRRHHPADFSPKTARKPSKITADVAPSTNIKPRKKPPKNIDCDLCEYKCRHKFQLKRHMSTHSGEKPFQCNSCPYQTAQKGHLKEHALIHGDQRPFACQYCEYASRTANNLRVHIGRRHKKDPFLRAAKTEFSCPLCTYKTALSVNLNSHMRTHTGDYLTCGVCNYKTIYPTALTRHQVVHTGEKPYHCKQCDYKCGHNSMLYKHIRKHHPRKTVQKPSLTANPECSASLG